MKKHRLPYLFLAILLVLACNLPQSGPATQPPLNLNASPTAIPGAPPAATAVPPSAVPTATTIPTPTVPQVTPISTAVNCRNGPDVAYGVNSTLSVGQLSQIAGRNDDSSWWYIHDPSNPSGFCWVSANVVTTAGSLAGIPIIAPPTGIVTSVTVDVSLPGSVFCGGPNASSFIGTITTNGPAKVTFDWGIPGGKTNTTSPPSLNFKISGTKKAPHPRSYSNAYGKISLPLAPPTPN